MTLPRTGPVVPGSAAPSADVPPGPVEVSAPAPLVGQAPADAPAQPTTVLVLTEDALTVADVEHITALHTEDDVEYRVLVPADTERNLLVSVVDHLGLGELRKALDEVLDRDPRPLGTATRASERLAGSLAALAAVGRVAGGSVVDDDPVVALAAEVAAGGVREVVVVTYPHAVEDTFHRDWASRARDRLRVPVLHLYAGTSELG